MSLIEVYRNAGQQAPSVQEVRRILAADPRGMTPAFVREFAPVLICNEVVQQLAKLIDERLTLHLRSGSGYLTRLLEEAGVYIESVDNGADDKEAPPPRHRTQTTDPIEFLKKSGRDYFGFLLLCPTLDEAFTREVIHGIPEDSVFVYFGDMSRGSRGQQSLGRDLRGPYRYDEAASHNLNRHLCNPPESREAWHVYHRRYEREDDRYANYDR
jgi:hypothetical protein